MDVRLYLPRSTWTAARILLVTWGSMGFSQYIKETYCYESRGTSKGVCLIEELYVSAQVSTKTGSSVSRLGFFPTIQSSHPWSSTSWSINPVFRGKKLCRCDPCIFNRNTTTHKWVKFILGEWNNLILCM